MRFLIFEMKTVCYNSYLYFGDALGAALKALGHNVEYFKMGEDGQNLDSLEKYIGTKYDALIDFNSDLPRALMDDDTYFLDQIDGPFWDIILDHPLYHHDSLKHKIKNFNVVCLDENHQKYINKYYPHIKNVIVTPMTGELAFGQSAIKFEEFENRPYDILFSGTYTNPIKIENSIQKMPKFLQENVYALIDMMLADSDITIEKAVERLAKEDIYDYINSDLPLHTQTFYLADTYVRCLNRKNLVLALDKSGHDFHIFGPLWDELELKNAHMHREIPFNLTFTIFAKSKISVNIMPNFKMGSHDRVFSSQLNGAVALTDATALLKSEYTDNENILFYDLNNIEDIPEIIDNALDNSARLKKIAQAGYNIACKNHTWDNIANILLKALV